MKTTRYASELKLYSRLLILIFLSNIGTIVLKANNHQELLSKDTSYLSFSGKVLNEQSEPLAYASISIKNSKVSTVSNADGEFLLKVPVELRNKNLIISFLGYQNLLLPIASLQERGNRFVLKASSLMLPDLTVVTKDPELIIKKMFDARSSNYSNKEITMTAFYRETIKNRNRNVSLAEAIVDIYKRSYSSGFQDLASLYKSRKNTDFNRLDTLVFKLMGGPYNSIYLDVMKYPEYIFTEKPFESYQYHFIKTDFIQDRYVYVVGFEPQPHIEIPLYYGRLYIDAENFALVKTEFDLDLTNNREATAIFLKRKPYHARVETTKAHYVVDYLLVDDVWYYSYSRIELDLKVIWKRKLFNSHYRTSIEMATTDWSDKTNRKEFKTKDRITPAVIIQNEASGFADPDFWGEYNIIEPDKSIENAIEKISKQLNKNR